MSKFRMWTKKPLARYGNLVQNKLSLEWTMNEPFRKKNVQKIEKAVNVK